MRRKKDVNARPYNFVFDFFHKVRFQIAHPKYGCPIIKTVLNDR